MRAAVRELAAMGKFPASHGVNLQALEVQQALIESIKPPVADDEVDALLTVLGSDEYYGLAWTLVHLIETAPGWASWLRRGQLQGYWSDVLQQRACNRNLLLD